MKHYLLFIIMSVLVLSGCDAARSPENPYLNATYGTQGDEAYKVFTPETVSPTASVVSRTEVVVETSPVEERYYMTCEEFFVDSYLQSKVSDLLNSDSYEYDPDTYVNDNGIITIRLLTRTDVQVWVNTETGSVRLKPITETLPAYIETTDERTLPVINTPPATVSEDKVVLMWGQQEVVLPRAAMFDSDVFFEDENAIECIELAIGEAWNPIKRSGEKWSQSGKYTTFSVMYNGYQVVVRISSEDNTLQIDKVFVAEETSPAPIQYGDDDPEEIISYEDLGPTRTLKYEGKSIVVAREVLENQDAFYADTTLRGCVEDVLGREWNRESQADNTWVAVAGSVVSTLTFEDCIIKISVTAGDWDLYITKQEVVSDTMITLRHGQVNHPIKENLFYAYDCLWLLKDTSFNEFMREAFNIEIDWVYIRDMEYSREGDDYKCSYTYNDQMYKIYVDIKTGRTEVEVVEI